jgi:hypothetical protein
MRSRSAPPRDATADSALHVERIFATGAARTPKRRLGRAGRSHCSPRHVAPARAEVFAGAKLPVGRVHVRTRRCRRPPGGVGVGAGTWVPVERAAWGPKLGLLRTHRASIGCEVTEEITHGDVTGHIRQALAKPVSRLRVVRRHHAYTCRP